MKNYLFLFIILLSVSVKAQFVPLSETAEISILTIGPGAELYDKFGHSAFRIKDPESGTDVVFNYGVYDFNTPNFYTKFARGKLLYELGVSYFEPFYNSYVTQNRWVKEQKLNLTHEEKQAISEFLWNNAKPENKQYKYDFFYDNCATKIRDVLLIALGSNLEFKDDYIEESLSFRELIQQNLNANTWGSMGIDIALGAVIDRQARPIEYQFLPDYVYAAAENAVIKRDTAEENLVKETKTLYNNTPHNWTTNFLLSPLFVLGLLAFLILFITYRDYKTNTRSRYLDTGIFVFTGLVGALLLFLWFGTDHTATANNYNLLWAFPISLLVVVAISGKNISPKIKRYVLLLILLLALLTIHWLTGVQVFAIALLPLLIALAVRYIFLMYFIGKQEE